MKRVFVWLLRIVAVVVGLVAVALTVNHISVGSELSRTFEAAGQALEIPDDEESIAEGERLARIRGCANGCHGESAGGQIFFEVFDGTRVVAPDLAAIVDSWNVEEIERVVRHGVRRDGTSPLAIMPSAMLSGMTDEDLALTLAYLGSLSPAEEQLPGTRVGPVARAMLAILKKDYGSFLAAEAVLDTSKNVTAPDDVRLREGWYLATTVCTECHAPDLNGVPIDSIPPLAIAATYSFEEFDRLMRKGIAIGDRELDLMAVVSERRFAYFTREEVGRLYRYLRYLGVGESHTDDELADIEAITDQTFEIARVTSEQGAAGNLTAPYLEYFSDNAVLNLPDGTEIKGKEAIANFYDSVFEGFQIISNEYRDPQVEIYGATATRTYFGHAVGVPPGADAPVSFHNRYSDVLVREDGIWKMQLHSFEPITSSDR